MAAAALALPLHNPPPHQQQHPAAALPHHRLLEAVRDGAVERLSRLLAQLPPSALETPDPTGKRKVLGGWVGECSACFLF